MKEQIISLLGHALTTSEVAEAVGCDPSYVSQIAGEHADEIATLRGQNMQKFLERDEQLEQAEDAALKRLATLTPFITRAGEAARVYSILNTAKRAARGNQAQQQTPSTVVNIMLSQAAAAQFVATATERQVVEINGRSMTPLPAANVVRMLKEQQAARLLETSVPASLVDKL